MNATPDEGRPPAPATILEVEGVPAYVRIREALRGAILEGVYQVGERIPSESDLAERYHVSRMTARRAVSDLADEGIVVRRPGSGTFVQAPRYVHSLSRLTSFFEEMLEHGMKPSSRLLHREITPAPYKVATALNIAEGDPVIRVDRLRMANGEPMAIHQVYVPYSLYPELLHEGDLESRSLLQLYEERGFRIARAQDHVEARLANERQAELLQIDVGAPLLYFERVTFTEDGTALELVKSFSRSDRRAYAVELSR